MNEAIEGLVETEPTLKPTVESARPKGGKPPVPLIQFGMEFGKTALDVIAEKMSPAHVGTIIEQKGIEETNHHKERMATISGTKWIGLASILSLVVIFFFFLHYGKAEMLRDIVIFLAGGAGGYGAKTYQSGTRSSKKS